MNKIEQTNPHLLGIPNESWNNVFGKLSYRNVFIIFPQVSKKCVDLVKMYGKLFDVEEIWKNLCLETNHASWNGKTFKPIEKGSFLSWKKVYLASEPSYYICKRRKYANKTSECEREIKTINQINLTSVYLTLKKYTWGNTEQEIADQNEKNTLITKCLDEIKLIEQKEKILFLEENLEKTVVATIGKQRFDQIPLFEDCLINKGLTLADNIDDIISQYKEDATFPIIVRGETDAGLKFLLAHPQRIAKNMNIPFGEHYLFIYSEKNDLVGGDITRFPNDTESFTMIHKGIPVSILKKLKNLVSTGFHENSDFFSKGIEYRLNFLWK